MIKLSQRAWNNVMIVSMLILIMLFNLSSKFLNDGSDDVSSLSTLVPTDRVITTIEFDQEKIERIGQGWRSKSGSYDNETLAMLVEHWISAEIRLVDVKLDRQSSTTSTTLWFAGQALPSEYQFMLLPDKTLVKIEQQTYQLITPNYELLTLPE